MARAAKLKVYRTPIGFHDAYVAAPSQKAALAAWGTDTNLFARGVAEIVTDEELAREPLAHPGEVIRRLRGSAAEQIAALPAGRKKKAPKRPVKSERPASAKAEPRPSRKALDAVETRLEELMREQEAASQDLARREEALAQERRALEKTQKRARVAAEKAVAAERQAHADALDRWLERQ